MRPEAASALLEKYPPRTVPDTWEATALSRAALTGRLLAPPYAETPWQLRERRLALRRFLDWLEQYPGDTWQQRWQASAIAGGGQADWRPAAADWLAARGDTGSREKLLKSVTFGLGQMIYAEAIRPGLAWVIASPVQFPLGREMPRLRDSSGFAGWRTALPGPGSAIFPAAGPSSSCRSSSRPRAAPWPTSRSGTAWSSWRPRTPGTGRP